MEDERDRALMTMCAILGTILEMSDDVKNAASPLDAQGKLLRMQNSIQNNAKRLKPYTQMLQDIQSRRAAS